MLSSSHDCGSWFIIKDHRRTPCARRKCLQHLYSFLALVQLSLCDGCDWLEPVQPIDALACRMAAAHEHVVFHVPTSPVLSIVVYYQPITCQAMQWSWSRVDRNNRIRVVAERIAVLNTALNFVLRHLYGCRIHHRHQGSTDGHHPVASGRTGSEFPPSPLGAEGDVTEDRPRSQPRSTISPRTASLGPADRGLSLPPKASDARIGSRRTKRHIGNHSTG